MCRSSLLTNVCLIVVGQAIIAACAAGAVEGSKALNAAAGPARLAAGPLTLEVRGRCEWVTDCKCRLRSLREARWWLRSQRLLRQSRHLAQSASQNDEA